MNTPEQTAREVFGRFGHTPGGLRHPEERVAADPDLLPQAVNAAAVACPVTGEAAPGREGELVADQIAGAGGPGAGVMAGAGPALP
jgi:hypothetical protein